jgi:predicted nucleic acid-binding protein
MGRIALPSSGLVYTDAQVVIYTVDKYPNYAPLCRPIWEAARASTITVISSQLILAETLVAPLRSGDLVHLADREALWRHPNTRLFPVTEAIIREAAQLRADFNLKTPDAIHAATALHHGCTLFVSNDTAFRRVPNLSVAILDDVLATP